MVVPRSSLRPHARSSPSQALGLHHPPSLALPLPPRPIPKVVADSTGSSRGRQGLSFRDALLTTPHYCLPPPPYRLPTRPSLRPRSPISSLLPLPHEYLLNPSLKGRCFRCFEKGHRAAQCREPRCCLLCMRIGHPASYCKFPSSPLRSRMDFGPFSSQTSRPSFAAGPSSRQSTLVAGPSSSRPSFAPTFSPPRSPFPGLPSLSGCVALVEIPSSFDRNAKEVIS